MIKSIKNDIKGQRERFIPVILNINQWAAIVQILRHNDYEVLGDLLEKNFFNSVSHINRKIREAQDAKAKRLI